MEISTELPQLSLIIYTSRTLPKFNYIKEALSTHGLSHTLYLLITIW